MDELKQIERLAKLAVHEGEDRVVPASELAAELVNEPKTPSITTGFPELDELIGNVEYGELVLVSGPTGGGKSSFMRSITKHISKNQHCLWFNFEDTNKQFLSRFDFNPPLFYMPRRNVENTVVWMNDRIDEAQEKGYDIKVVFIDHLHAILSQMRFQGNLSMEIGDIVQKIKDFATQKNLIVFLGAHCLDLQDKSIIDYRKEHVRDSGMIVRIADTVLLIWRVPDSLTIGQKFRVGDELGPNDTKAILKIDKSRREGKLGRMFLKHTNHFFTEYYNFEPIVENQDEEIKVKDIWS